MLSRKIEYLMALAKEGHFARAAAMCHVSQPTLSAAIQDLEAELGVAIVRRGQRFQGLTPEGELVLRAATRMAAERDQLHQQLGQESRDGAGSLRIGALQSTIPLLRSFTVPFRKRFPDVNLNVRAQSPADVQDAMEARALDVAITYLDQSIKRRCRTRTLYLERYELLIRKGTALSGRAKASWEDLRELPLCLLSPESPIFGAWESELLRDTLAKTPHIVTNAIWLVMDHVRTGQWASVLPRPVRAMIPIDPELESIPLPVTGKPNPVAIAIRGKEPVSPMAKAFFEIATSDTVLQAVQASLGSIQELEAQPSPMASIGQAAGHLSRSRRE